MIYALVLNGQILRKQAFSESPPLLATCKGRWLPIEDQSVVDYDPAVERLVDRVVDGVVITSKEERVDLEKVKAEFISRLKAQTTAAILEQAPEFKQRNAALGIYSAEEAEAIRQVILTHRAACDAKEILINAATSAYDVRAAYQA